MAAFFSRPFYTPETSFAPLFRLLDDFDTYNRETQGQNPTTGGRGRGSQLFPRLMTPNFDVHETDDAYELHGELPGVDKKDIEITFPEPQTIVIKGKVERTYTSGTPPEEEGPAGQGEATPKEPTKEVASKPKAEVTKAEAPKEKLWVSERSVGEFSRNFSFPQRVDAHHVSASLTDGILSVTVPKIKQAEPHRITVS